MARIGGGTRGNEFAGARPAAESTTTAMDVINRLLGMGVDTNHQLTRKRPYGAGRGRFQDYDLRGGVGPLFVAAMRHDHESIQALLAHGAEVDLTNVFQMTPLMMAAGMSGTGRGAGGFGAPAAAPGDPQARAIKTLDLLLDAGADVNYRIVDSRTHTAKLMSYVAGRDQEGRTALFAAAEQGQDRIVKHLLERGADASIRDAAGKTALDVARVAPQPAGGAAAAAATANAARPGAAAAAAASRAATIAALEAAVARSGLGGASPPVK